jgi:hypothetical protein
VIIFAFHTRKVNDNEKAVHFIMFDVFSFVHPTRYSQNIVFYMCYRNEDRENWRAPINMVMSRRVAKCVGNLIGRRIFSCV